MRTAGLPAFFLSYFWRRSNTYSTQKAAEPQHCPLKTSQAAKDVWLRSTTRNSTADSPEAPAISRPVKGAPRSRRVYRTLLSPNHASVPLPHAQTTLEHRRWRPLCASCILYDRRAHLGLNFHSVFLPLSQFPSYSSPEFEIYSSRCLPTISPQTCVKPSHLQQNLRWAQRWLVPCCLTLALSFWGSLRPAQDSRFTFSESSETNHSSPVPPLDNTWSARSHHLALTDRPWANLLLSPHLLPPGLHLTVGNRICSLSSDLHHPVQDVLIHKVLFSPHSS